MVNRLIIGSSLLMLAACATAMGGTVREYKSPDGRFRGVIVPRGAGESRVELRSADGALLFAHSYASADGGHGFGVQRAAWTPDSKFFVYSLSNSGGHQPWHTPIDFLSVVGPKLHSLDDHVGLIGDSDFTVSAPSRVRASTVRLPDLELITVDVSLPKIIERGATDAEPAAPPDREDAPGR